MSRALTGLLHLKVTKAKDLRVVQLIGKQDPYCRIDGPLEQEFKTKVIEDGGKAASWGEAFDIVLPESGDSKSRSVKVTVLDQNVTVDALIGSTSFSPEQILKYSLEGKADWFEIQHDGKKAGEVWLEFKFTPGLAVKIHEAKDLKDERWVGKQDPYLVLHLGKQKMRTKVAVDGEKNPVWEETHFFTKWPNVDAAEMKDNAFKATVMDEKVGLDNELGEIQLPWSKVEIAKGKGVHWYPVWSNRKSEKNQVGEISISVEALHYDKHSKVH